MKKILSTGLLSLMVFAALNAQYDRDRSNRDWDDDRSDFERSGYYGDNFSLEGALDVFEKSRNLEDFEYRLNREDTWVNNLDLDNDRRIDYVRVEHRRYDRNFHAIILQVQLGRYDVQDIAVIELNQVGNRRVDLQIVGDEDIYGNEIFVEPYGDSEREIYRWRVVQSILDNQYITYVSPYRYGYYPQWWSPWRPCAWDIFRPRIIVYHQRFRVINTPRFVYVRNYYRPHRTYCNNVVVYSNNIRVKHGHQPINRPVYSNNDRRDNNYYGSRRTQSAPDNGRNYGGSRSNGNDDNLERSSNERNNSNSTRSDSPRSEGKVRDQGRSNTERRNDDTYSSDRQKTYRGSDETSPAPTPRRNVEPRNQPSDDRNREYRKPEKSEHRPETRDNNPQVRNKSTPPSSPKGNSSGKSSNAPSSKERSPQRDSGRGRG